MFYMRFDCLSEVGLGRQGVGVGRWGSGRGAGGGGGGHNYWNHLVIIILSVNCYKLPASSAAKPATVQEPIDWKWFPTNVSTDFTRAVDSLVPVV